MTEFKLKFADGPILVDLTPTEKPTGLGYREAGQDDRKKKDAEDRSNEAVNNALETIYRTAGRLSAALAAIEKHDHPPGKVEVEFGLSLKEDSHVIIAQVGGETHFKVKLTWDDPSDDK